MINKEDIEKAIIEKRPLFYDRSEMTYEAYQCLIKLPIKDIDLLFSEFPKSTGKHKTYIHVVLSCPMCHKQYSIKMSKTSFKETKAYGIESLIKRESHYNLTSNDMYEVEKYITKIQPENDEWDTNIICMDCKMIIHNKIEDIYNEFYEHPLTWVNTHSAEKHSWQWDAVHKLYTYPQGYENKPDGWKYCGVKYKSRRTGYLSEVFDSDYYNWKSVMNKSVIESKISTAHELIQKLFGGKLMSPNTLITHKKTIELLEVMLDGMINNCDLPSLLNYTVTECNKILANYKKLSVTSRKFMFGKYKGLTIHNVIEIDPEYIYWAMNKVEGFFLNEEEWEHYMGKDWPREYLDLLSNNEGKNED